MSPFSLLLFHSLSVCVSIRPYLWAYLRPVQIHYVVRILLLQCDCCCCHSLWFPSQQHIQHPYSSLPTSPSPSRHFLFLIFFFRPFSFQNYRTFFSTLKRRCSLSLFCNRIRAHMVNSFKPRSNKEPQRPILFGKVANEGCSETQPTAATLGNWKPELGVNIWLTLPQPQEHS